MRTAARSAHTTASSCSPAHPRCPSTRNAWCGMAQAHDAPLRTVRGGAQAQAVCCPEPRMCRPAARPSLRQTDPLRVFPHQARGAEARPAHRRCEREAAKRSPHRCSKRYPALRPCSAPALQKACHTQDPSADDVEKNTASRTSHGLRF